MDQVGGKEQKEVAREGCPPGRGTGGQAPASAQAPVYRLRFLEGEQTPSFP